MTNMSIGTEGSEQCNQNQANPVNQKMLDCVYSRENGGNCSGNCKACFEYSGFELEVPIKIDPIALFREELGQILDERVVFIVKHILRVAPLYFYAIPASTTGKYHPKYTLGVQGLVRHVKAAVRVFLEMCHNNTFGEYSDYELDVGIAALILHDIAKCGYGNSQYTVHEHPMLVESLCTDWGSAEYNVIWKDINDLIKTHTGQWVFDYRNSDAPKLEEPKTSLQKFIHQCDYIASRRIILVDLDVPLENYRSKKESTSSPKKASKAQLKYLVDLTSKLKNKGIEVPKEISEFDFTDPESSKISEFIDMCLKLLR